MRRDVLLWCAVLFAGPGCSGEPEAPLGAVMATLSVTRLFQSCMPVVAPDPLQLQAALQLRNVGGVPVGPLSVTQGEVLDAAGLHLAAFAVNRLDFRAVPPGEGTGGNLEKTAGSLMPQQGCMTARCGAEVRVAVDVTGPGVPEGTRATSDAARVMCAF